MLRKILAGGTIAAASTLLIGPPALADTFYPCSALSPGAPAADCGTLTNGPQTGPNPISISNTTTTTTALSNYFITIDSQPTAVAGTPRAFQSMTDNGLNSGYFSGIAYQAGGQPAAIGVNATGMLVGTSSSTFVGGSLNGATINGSSMTLNSSGATFSNATTGAPIPVTGVADGVNPFDAVNFRQLQAVSSGVASIAAMSNIPGLDPNKKFGIGIGYGNFQGNSALAVGINGRLAPSLTAKLSVGAGLSYGATTVGTGLSYSW